MKAGPSTPKDSIWLPADALSRQGEGPRGRGASTNPSGRFEAWDRNPVDDGWGQAPPGGQISTRLYIDNARSALSFNRSPDVPFDRSVNPYRGCEHGCIYCYARPSHAFLGLSPALDFESQLFHKPGIANLLRQELSRSGYRTTPVGLGANTDCYQPVERRLKLTRAVISVLAEFNHPLMIVTKGALVERDIDLLAPLAARGLAEVHVSIATLDHHLARAMEPRATAPRRRLQIVRNLSDAGIPTGVLVAPMIAMLNDAEMETILGQARNAGASAARYSVLRLPHELDGLFENWLHQRFPLKAKRVLARIEDLREGHRNDSRFGVRMRGRGQFADLLSARFLRARQRLGFPGHPPLDVSQFSPPSREEPQLELF